MEYLVFKDEMMELLRNIKGKRLKSIRYLIETKRRDFLAITWGSIYLNVGDDYIKLNRELEIKEYFEMKKKFGIDEELGEFRCCKYDATNGFECYDEETYYDKECHLVDQTIEEIIIVRDEIDNITCNYSITIDEAIIIKTEKNNYVFIRGSRFDEDVELYEYKKEENYRKYIYTYKELLEEWGASDEVEGEYDEFLIDRREIVL